MRFCHLNQLYSDATKEQSGFGDVDEKEKTGDNTEPAM